MNTAASLAPDVLDQLRSIVGPAGFLDQAIDVEPFLVDHRRLYRGATPLVLRPDSTEQVSRILKFCNEHRIGVVPVGGNTSYCGGATPSSDGTQVVVSMSRLKRVRHIDPDNYTLTVEAGRVLAEVQESAEAADRLFPLSLGSEGSCQIGGNLSTNAGGTAVLRYGMTRELVLGLEVVLPDGRVLDDLTGLRKNNMGYDLRDLFMGAEGTLGIITAVTLKLFPLPKTHVTALVAVNDPAAAVALLSHLRSNGVDGLVTFELMSRYAVGMVFKHIEGVSDPFDAAHPWYVLVEATSSQISESLNEQVMTVLVDAQEKDIVRDALLAQNTTQRELFWRIRETIPEAQTRTGTSIKHDVSVAISDVPRFISEGMARCQAIAPAAALVVYGHLGDGSLHFNAYAPKDWDKPTVQAMTRTLGQAMYELAASYRGSISAEHGIGKFLRDELAQFKNPVAMQVMRAIKQSLDPNGIMNPGKVVATL